MAFAVERCGGGTSPARPAVDASPAAGKTGADALSGAEAARKLRLRVDGGSRGNPGPGAIGAVLEDLDGRVVETVSRVIGVCTNNVAEYRALSRRSGDRARRRVPRNSRCSPTPSCS